MASFIILAGGYTTFIASYLFNPSAPSLTLLNQSPTGVNPSWIAAHPTNSSILYAVNEDTVGQLQSFLVGQNGALVNVANASSGGNGPAFANPLSTGEVAIMNFGSGDGKFVPTLEDPLEFNDISALVKFPVPNKPAPDNASRPHMALEFGSEVLIPDLGADTVYRLSKDNTTRVYQIKGQLDSPAGSGPRHIAIKDDMLYTIHEKDNTLTQQQIPADVTAPSPVIASFNITPPNPPAGSQFAAAEIRLLPASTQFNKSYIYASNRNIGSVQDPQGDAIAIYEVEPELKFVKHVFTGLQQIRGMEFGGDEKEFLVAAGFAGDAGVKVFKRTAGGADLEFVAESKDIPTRTSFVFLDV